MKHKYSYLAALSVSLFLMAGCRGLDCVNGSGHQVTENRTVDPFKEIELGGAIKLVVKQGASHQLRIVADDNIQQQIETRVHGDKLSIDMDGNFCNTGPVTVYATTPTLEGVDASGAVEVLSDGTISSETFYLELSGSSKVNLLINTGEMRTDASGSTDVILKGQARSHDVDMSGSGDVNALEFVVGDYRIKTSGATNLKINALNKLDVESSGSSEISYRGNPKNVNNSNSGASSLNKIQ